jgi:hypothetical protein
MCLGIAEMDISERDMFLERAVRIDEDIFGFLSALSGVVALDVDSGKAESLLVSTSRTAAMDCSTLGECCGSSVRLCFASDGSLDKSLA